MEYMHFIRLIFSNHVNKLRKQEFKTRSCLINHLAIAVMGEWSYSSASAIDGESRI
jgi:hypothetical protein